MTVDGARRMNGTNEDELEQRAGGAEGRRASLAAGADPPLVEAKLAIPSVHHGVVDRPRVRRVLDAGGSASLTLVAAPAGYGKTTAVRAWCASLDAALAWVTLDDGDNDPVVLWRYVATAVDRVRSGLGRGALRRLGVAGGPVEVAIDELMNGVASLGGKLVVVLDDLHVVIERGVPVVDRLRRWASSSERAFGAVDAGGSGVEARSAACRGRGGRGAWSRARVHARRGAGAARGARSSRARCGGDRHAGEADRGLARWPRPGVVVAAGRWRIRCGRCERSGEITVSWPST